MYLVVTIDTEEDNWGEYARKSYSVENIRRIPGLQRIFDRHGVRPTYLVSYPVATSSWAVETLGRYRDAGLCEIGAHPHPWNTPPIEEERTPSNSFIHHLPVDLQYRKIACLHQAIRTYFGIAPRSYRSGRWGFDENIARHLIHLGYAVDTSLSPAIDWSEYGGPDYSDQDLRPFVYEQAASQDSAGGRLLELPATIDFVQVPPRAVRVAYWAMHRRGPLGRKVLASFSRMGALNHVCLSPEIHDAEQMIRLTNALMRRHVPVVNMFFHSPSLLAGCSPFVRTSADAVDFVNRIDRFLSFAARAGLQPVSISELTAVEVGATRVRTLSPGPSPEVPLHC
jgi:hypothetical protein